MPTFGPLPAVVVSIHDGDTFRVLVTTPRHEHFTDVGWNVQATAPTKITVDVRLNGCNAAELATAQGKAALAYLQGLMPVGTAVTLVSYGPDKYGGRWDCSIKLPNGADLTATMIAAGQAAPWDGQGPKPVPAS